MGYLINLTLDGKPAVVIGGGNVAKRKVTDLLEAKAVVTVVAPEACEAIRKLAEQQRIQVRLREYRSSDLSGAYLVIAAADDEAVNVQVHNDAQALGILINVVDRPALCSFTVPATVKRGDLTIAIATDGRSPALSGVLREELEHRYGEEYAGLVQLMGDLRKHMLDAGWTGERIRGVTSELYHSGIVEAIASRDGQAVRDLVRAHTGPDFDVDRLVSLRPPHGR